MAMDLDGCCRLAQDILGVSVTPLADPVQQAAFCAKNQFHPSQTYLVPQQFDRILKQLPPGEILSLTDPFRVRYLFFRLEGVPVAIGPFCTEIFSLSDCQTLLRQADLRDITAQDLQIRRGICPVHPESELMHLARSLARALGLGGTLSHLRQIELESSRQREESKLPPQQLYAEQIIRRYQSELHFMDCIRRADANAALHAWRQLHQAVAYTKKLGQTLETARIAAAINRTTIRLAAADAGIPAVVNDLLSGESSRIIRSAKSIDEINAEHERVIRVYCQTIREQRDARYSSLVLSAMYQMAHHYAQRITVPELAAELEVSPAWLTAQFRRETGKTPAAYLNEIRMQQAARRLTEGSAPVSQVAAEVGILDANYFIKRFKQAYGQTPLAYRRSHRL